MSPELEEKLYADFPTVFLPRAREHGGDPFRWFGFEIDNGWEPIVRDAAAKLALLSPHIHAAQVKEKFGGMRFYLTFGDDVPNDVREAAWAITSAAEAASCGTCEGCGAPGKIGSSPGINWLHCLCEPCRVAWAKERLGGL